MLNKRTTGITFVLSAPAGTGKSTLVDMLTKEFPHVIRSISYTTRPPRPGEIDGVHYFFISDSEFDKKIAENDFVEHITLFGHRYGTSKAFLKKAKNDGKHVFLVIDTQGAIGLMGKSPAVFIFLMPPTLEELQKRLATRGTETDQIQAIRLNEAKREIEAAKNYDYIVVNDDLQKAYTALRSIVIAEEHRVT
jgi:guanylate kinase